MLQGSRGDSRIARLCIVQFLRTVRRGYACLRQALIADRVEDETMLCVQQSMISNPARVDRLLTGGEAVTVR